MKAFAALYSELDATTGNNAKLAALVAYLRNAPAADAAWAVYFLAGGKPRQLVPTKLLRERGRLVARLPEWLFDECYHAVGDLAETIALLLPQPTRETDEGLAVWVEHYLLPLRGAEPQAIGDRLMWIWDRLSTQERLVCGKLLTGSFRVGVSRLLVTRALAEVAGVDPKRVAERLVGYTDIRARPGAAAYHALVAPDSADAVSPRSSGQPYPFFLAHPLPGDVTTVKDQLGAVDNWLVEWKWDGIRAQLVKRDGRLWLWSRGEELITERFPEFESLADCLPDGTVIDGEIVVWCNDRAQPFALLQQRIGRKKKLSQKLLDELPAVLLSYDLLEWQYADWRGRAQSERRQQLEQVVGSCGRPVLRISPVVAGSDWDELAQQRELSRENGVEGLMLKGVAARYGIGRTRTDGIWWKWKVEPYSVDAVLIYAQRGHGRRASLYTDYTFAVWDAPAEQPNRQLVPFAKAYSGLSDAEIRKVDAIIRKTTVEKFGPVRSVEPTLLFELGFEGIARSTRHKSGVAVRFPRMLRWRQDKPIDEADTLATLQALL